MKGKTLIQLCSTIAIWLIATTLVAQTQQGYVKTKGRLVNGKVIPGQGLSGAVVSMKGRSSILVDQHDGRFSFPVVTKSFVISDVSKQGYQLVDADVLQKTYQYAPEPIYIIMETPEQMLEDQLEVQSRLSTALRKQYQRSLAENKRLREQQLISQETYEQKMQQLINQQQQNSIFLSKLVDDFAKVDYDQLDEFNRQVHELILNGEFSKADSMLKSKGDMSLRIDAFRKEWQALSKQESDLSAQQQTVTSADTHLRKLFTDLAQDCMSKHQIFKLREQNDSAAYYIELRASIDTVNLEFQRHAGDFLAEYSDDYDKALTYYHRAQFHANRIFGDDSEWSCTIINQIANVYFYQKKYEEALRNYQQVLAGKKKNQGEKTLDVSIVMGNIARIYADYYKDYQRALEIYDSCLIIRQKLFGQQSEHVADVLARKGDVYNAQDEVDNALSFYQQALDIRLEVFGENHLTVANTLNTIGNIYHQRKDYATAVTYLERVASIRKRLLGERHPRVSVVQNRLAEAYYALQQRDKALACYEDVIRCGPHPNGLTELDISVALTCASMICHKKGDKQKAIDYILQNLAVTRKVYGEQSKEVAMTLKMVGAVYNSFNYLPEAIDSYQQAMEVWKASNGDYSAEIASCKQDIFLCRYKQAVAQGITQDFLQHCAFTLNVTTDGPASQQGLTGEYILLEFADWTQDSSISLFAKNTEWSGKPKDVVILRGGVVLQIHFQNNLGASLSVKEVSVEEKQHITQAYQSWKQNNQ